MSAALRFPKADGSMIVVTEQTHASETYTREVRISVRHIVCYKPAGEDQTTMQIEGRSQPLRLQHTVDELDALIGECDERAVGLDVVPT